MTEPTIPASFLKLSSADRTALRRQRELEQLTLCDEPDHRPEKIKRYQLDDMRGQQKRDAFENEVRRQREAREKAERMANR